MYMNTYLQCPTCTKNYELERNNYHAVTVHIEELSELAPTDGAEA